MTKKISLGIVVILVVATVIITAVSCTFIILNHYSGLIKELPERAEQYIKLSELDELVRREYYGETDNQLIDEKLAVGYIDGLNDSNSYYISANDFPEYNDYLQGKIYGTGINAYYDMSSGYLRIAYISPDSPADTLGLTTDCYIVSVNGVGVTEENCSELLDVLTDGYGKKAKITYIPDLVSNDEPIESEIVLGYDQKSCEYTLNGNVGYVRISAFTEKTLDLFSEAVEYFKSNSVSAVIIDVRNCSGANFDVSARLIDMIVPVGSEGTGAIYTAKNYNGEIVTSYSSDTTALNFSIAVLINSRTESAAELLAVDLLDFGKAVLVGERTAGHGTMQKLFPMEDGGAVCLTVAKIYPYRSDSFDIVGIEPDIIIETSEAFKNQLDFTDFTNDEQYNKAYSYLTGN